MQKQKLIVIVSFIIAGLLMGAPLSVYSSASFSRIQSKGNTYMAQLSRIYGKYPVRTEKITRLRLLEEKWILHIKNYERSSRSTRSESLQVLKKTYFDILTVMKSTADDMQMYSKDLVLDFTDRIHDVDTDSMTKKEYNYYYESRNHFQLAKQEFHRAHNAYLRKQYSYSVALYDRGIAMMRNTYTRLNWALPKNLQKAS